MSLFGLILSIVAFSVGFECVHDLHRYKEYLVNYKAKVLVGKQKRYICSLTFENRN